MASKLDGLGDGSHSSCMSFAGLGHATMTIFTRSKPYLREESQRSLSSKPRPSIALPGITLWMIWIAKRKRYSFVNNGMSPN